MAVRVIPVDLLPVEVEAVAPFVRGAASIPVPKALVEPPVEPSKVTHEASDFPVAYKVEAGGIEPRTTGIRNDPRTAKTRTYLLRLSRQRPPYPAIWALGAQN